MIRIDGVSKEFRVYKRRSGMLRQIFGIAREKVDYDIVRSLSGVSLHVPKGKVHGIIGMNGAGKSTLLKILTGVLTPTAGKVKMEGRVAALLELGTGFHGELTGRENVYLNGTIMGFSRAEVEAKLPYIMDFAELGEFFDRPVKIYSSGMYVRLAFAFAVAVEPEILIIDEALSVGDAYFQQKCLKKMRQFKDSGTTILFVSHDLGAVKMLCEEVSLLSKGKVVFTGSPMQALDLYNALLAEHQHQDLVEARSASASEIQPDRSYESGTKNIEIKRVTILDLGGQESLALVSGEPATIIVDAIVNDDEVSNPTCGILVRDRLGYDVFGTNTFSLKVPTGVFKRSERVRFRFDMQLNLGAGDYVLTVALHSDRSHVDENYHWIERAQIFKVLPSTDLEFIGVARLTPSCSVSIGH